MRKHHCKRLVVRRMFRPFLAAAAATLCFFGSTVTGSVWAPHAAAAIVGTGHADDVADTYALAQLGKPYVYGAAGPSGYDCSGLVYGAWRRAGVPLPRVAAQQYGSGRHVPLNQLHPGDLVFWGHDPHNPASIYHVAMYVGFGAVVHAPHPGARVSVTSLRAWRPTMPFGTRP